MLTELHIQNFKSVRDLRLQPGRVTVLIGENGSGKSNILEALAFAAGAAGNKLDNEFLVTRGIRVTEPRFMRSSFEAEPDRKIHIAVTIDDRRREWDLVSEGEEASARWVDSPDEMELILLGDGPDVHFRVPRDHGLVEQIAFVKKLMGASFDDAPRRLPTDAEAEGLTRRLLRASATSSVPILADVLLYSPENTALRTFEHEGQILPLGIKGEGLFALLKRLARDEARMAELRENLRLLDWFEDLRIASDLAPFERTLQIRDRFLDASQGGDLAYFGQRSANEGFLFLLFYFALFISPDTPRLFAVDNIDASLNPKLCSELMRRLVALAKAHDKQVLITTHNPAVLDGLDLHDDEQRLFVVHRNSSGHTRARRIAAPKPLAGEAPVKLSEAFMRGLIGGLPQNF